jgi:hypothetical protein
MSHFTILDDPDENWKNSEVMRNFVERMEKQAAEQDAEDPFGPNWRQELWENDPDNPDAHPNPDDYLDNLQRGKVSPDVPANPIYADNYSESYTLLNDDRKRFFQEVLEVDPATGPHYESLVASVELDRNSNKDLVKLKNGLSLEVMWAPSSSVGETHIELDDFNQVAKRVDFLMNANLGKEKEVDIFNANPLSRDGNAYYWYIVLPNDVELRWAAGVGRASSPSVYLPHDEIDKYHVFEVWILTPGYNDLVSFSWLEDVDFPWADNWWDKKDVGSYVQKEELLKIYEWLQKNSGKFVYANQNELALKKSAVKNDMFGTIDQLNKIASASTKYGNEKATYQIEMAAAKIRGLLNDLEDGE